MSLTISLRLLWKEYRVQRGLWLALALGTILLQTLGWLTVDRTEYSYQGVVISGLLMTCFYAIGSGAVTFAVEREENTHLRLVAMSAPAGLTLFIKLAFGIVASVLLLALTVVAGLAFLTVAPGLANLSGILSDAGWMIPLLIFTPMLVLGGLLWGMFFSLLFRKVLVALAAAGGAMIGSGLLVLEAYSGIEVFLQRNLSTEPVESIAIAALGLLTLFGLGAVGLAVANWVLASWWLSRGFADTGPPRRWFPFRPVRLQWERTAGGMVVEVGSGSDTTDEVLAAERAIGLPAPRIGLDWLHTLQPRRRLRTLGHLCWKEALETRRFFLGMWAVGMGLTALRAGGLGREVGGDVLGYGVLFSAAALGCGLMTFRSEQFNTSFRWCAVRGIGPGVIWLSKQLVWLTRLVATLLVLFALVLLTNPASFGPTVNFWLLGTPDVSSQASWHAQGDTVSLRSVIAGRAAIMMLVFYSIGQVASLMFRRGVLAVFLGFVGCLAAFFWMVLHLRFDVAYSCAVLPMVPALLMFTWLRGPGWMLEDNRPMRWVAPGAALIAGAAACLLLTGLYRTYQIPAPPDAMVSYRMPNGTTGRAELGVPDDLRREALAPLSPAEEETADLYRQAAEKLANLSPAVDIAQLTTPVAWSELREEIRQWTVTNREALGLARQAASRDACALVSPRDVTVQSPMPGLDHFRVLVALAVAEARRLEAEGDLDAALDLYRDALAICRHAQGRGLWIELSTSCERFRMVNAGLVQWSSHDDIDEAMQAKAAGMVLEYRQTMVPLAVVNLNEYQMLRNSLNTDPERYLAGDGWYQESIWYRTAAHFPGAESRNHRLLDWLEAESARVVSAYVDQMAATPPSMGTWYRLQVEREAREGKSPHRRWLNTTPLLDLLYGPPNILCRVDANCEADVRATLLSMQLLAARRKGGEWPANLDSFADARLFDPWTGSPFDWYPDGIPNEIHATGLSIPKGVPFLFSGGSSQYYLQRHEGRTEYSLVRKSSAPIESSASCRVWLLP